jgi:hypothetical protein
LFWVSSIDENVSEKHTVSIFRAEDGDSMFSSQKVETVFFFETVASADDIQKP